MSDLTTLPFVRALQECGARVYMVGGTVRDTLLGHPRKDIDLLVTGVPQTVLIRFLRRHGRVQLTGRLFGVIKFLPPRWHGLPIDIALPRTEISTGIGHRDFTVSFDHTLPIEVDLGRRDFTINAMALDLSDGHLIDPFGGRRDLAQRRLRQVSQDAFPEDPLRMLRGVQLATRFDLYVDADTRRAMQRHAALITTVAAERVAEELRKLFQATRPSRGFFLLREMALLPHLIPEVDALIDVPYDATSSDAFTHTMHRLDAIQQHEVILNTGQLDILLAALLQDSGLPEAQQAGLGDHFQHLAQRAADLAQQRLLALRITTVGAHPDRIATLIRHRAFQSMKLTRDADLRRLAHRVGPETAFLLFDLWLADRLAHTPPQPIDDLLGLRQRLRDALNRQVPLRIKDLAINGHDLQRLGIAPGPQMGRILEALLQRVLDNPASNTRDELLNMVRTAYQTQPAKDSP